jgi:hypothetical protein
MIPEQSFVDSALRTWRSNTDRASNFFGSLSEEELELRVAPSRNRLIYILGHLTAMNDTILPLFGFGPASTQSWTACSFRSPTVLVRQ